jgi:hypothetical protein
MQPEVRARLIALAGATRVPGVAGVAAPVLREAKRTRIGVPLHLSSKADPLVATPGTPGTRVAASSETPPNPRNAEQPSLPAVASDQAARTVRAPASGICAVITVYRTRISG